MEAIDCAGLLGLAGHYLQNNKQPVSERRKHDGDDEHRNGTYGRCI